MDKKLIQSLLAILAILASGCAVDETTPEDITVLAPPTNLTWIADANKVNLSWQSSPDQGTQEFLGYIIYGSTNSLAGVNDKVSLATYQLNASPVMSATFTVTSLTAGTKYYFHVRCAQGKPDDYKISQGTNEINTSPLFIDNGTIYEFASQLGNPSGYNFKDGAEISMRYQDAANIDLYLGTTADGDGNADLVLKSPNKVKSTHTEWASRITQIKLLGDDWNAINQITDTGWNSNNYELVQNGKVYGIKTPDNHFVKLQITQLSGAYPDRTVSFKIGYQTIASYPNFAPMN